MKVFSHTLCLRRRTYIAALFTAASALVLWSQTGNFRCVMLQCLALVYGVWDPLSREFSVDMGPSAAQSSYNSGQLTSLFPGCTVEVSHPGSTTLGSSAIFQHE